MFNLNGAQGLVLLVLGCLAFAMQVFALVDAARHRPDAFTAASKRTKQFWVIVLAVAAALGFVSVLNPLNIFSLLAVVAAGIYLADVRPALRQVSGGRGNGGQHMGPYGPW
jgi:lysylphosphatidylglycerol synthetase-like protein (DUF2156 family)